MLVCETAVGFLLSNVVHNIPYRKVYDNLYSEYMLPCFVSIFYPVHIHYLYNYLLQ